MPKATLTLKQVGRAMINAVLKGYPKQISEVDDIRQLAKQYFFGRSTFYPRRHDQ